MATDLPMPSGMKREVASLAAILMTGTFAVVATSASCGSCATTGIAGIRLVLASSAAKVAARINLPVAMSPYSPRSLISPC